MKKLYFISFLIGVIIGQVVGALLFYRQPQSNVDLITHDTVKVSERIVTTETIHSEKPFPVRTSVKDTLIIPSSDKELLLPVETKEYRDSNYTAWVSGIYPSLDSICVYKKIEYVRETRTVTNEIIQKDNRVHFYVGGGIDKYSDKYTPQISVFGAKNNILVGCNIGLVDKYPVYGIKINYKIR